MSMFSTHSPSFFKPNNDHQDAPTASYNIDICFSISPNPIFSSTQFWIVDLSATRHMCCSVTTFVSLRPIQNSTITLPNHIQIPTSFYGDVTLSSMLTLKDVLFVPQFKYNLISMSALTYGSQFPISFILDCFIIQELNTTKMIGKGDKLEDLYILDTNTLKYVSTFFINNVLDHVWHNRLGHLSFKHLNALKNHLHYDVSC